MALISIFCPPCSRDFLLRPVCVTTQRLGEREKELVVAEGGLLNWLLAAKDEVDGSGMSDQYLRDEMNTLIIAGAETTGITLTWTCTLLAQHPEVMRKIAGARNLNPNNPKP